MALFSLIQVYAKLACATMKDLCDRVVAGVKEMIAK